MADPTDKTRLESEKSISEQLEKQTKLLEKVATALEKVNNLQKDIIVQNEKNITSLEEELKLIDEKIKNASTQEEKMAALVLQQEVGIKKLEEELELLRNQRREKEKSGTLSKEQIEELKKEEKRKQQEIKNSKEAYEKFKEDNKEILELLKKQNEQKEKENKILEKNKETLNKGLEVLGSTIASSMALGDVWSNTVNNKIGLSNALFLKLLSSAGEMFGTVMNANSEFAKTTGQIADRSVNFGAGATQFGIGFEKMHKAQMALYTSMSGFSNQSRGVQESLTMTAAKMELVGVSASTTGQNLDMLTRAFGMNAERAGKVQEEIARHAIAAGIAPKQMAEDFGKYASQMSVYGEKGIDVFVRMEKASKSLGVSMDTLNSLVGQNMDTFQGAASAAGKLNAVLGGNYLNSLELINANEADRILLIKRSVEASGVQFDQMGKFQQRAIANALGIKDVAEANKLLSKSSAELSVDMNKRAADEKKLQEIQKEAAAVQDQIKVAFEQLLIAVRPVVELLKGMINVITGIMDAGNGWVGRIAVMGLAIIKLGSMLNTLRTSAILTKAALFFGNAAQGFGFAAGWIVGGLGKIASAMGSTRLATLASNAATFLSGKVSLVAAGEKEVAADTELIAAQKQALATRTSMSAAAEAIPIMLAFGAAILMIGGGIFLAAYGLAQLVMAFKGLDGPQIIGATIAIAGFGIMLLGLLVTLGILAFSGLGPAAVAILDAFGLAVLLVGIGIGIAAAGMALLIKVIGDLAKGLGAEAATNVTLLAGSIMTLGYSIGFLLISTGGPIGLLALGIFFVSLSAGILLLNNVINDRSIEKLNAFGNALGSFAKVMQLSGINSTAKEIASAIGLITEQIDKIPESKAVAFSASMNSLGNTLAQVKTVEVEKLKSAKEFVSTAKEYYVAQSMSKDGKDDALVQALTKVLASGKKEGGGGGGTVILQVNGATLGKVLLPYVKEGINTEKVDPTTIQSGR